MPDCHIDVTNRLDTWYAIFSPHVEAEHLNRWMVSATDEGYRHVYVVKRAGAMGVMQIEATAFGGFCEYVPVSIPDYLLDAKHDGNRVLEWGVQWTPDRMSKHIQSETLAIRPHEQFTVNLETLRSTVYIQPGYFSCVALAKVFLAINDSHVLKPRELLDYMLLQGAEEV